MKYLTSVAKELGFKKLVLAPFAYFFVFCLTLFCRFKNVQIHLIVNSRIGHFALNTEISRATILENNLHNDKKSVNLFCFQSPTSSNRALENMWRRNLTCFTGSWSWLVYDLGKRISPSLIAGSTSLDRNGVLVKHRNSNMLLPNEIASGVGFLRSIGIGDGDEFVCLNVRDSSFLANSHPIAWSKTRDWSYHNYRDTDIRDYVAAAEALAEMGYTVFRMGALVANPLRSTHPKVIDYATNGMRTEFLDIFLGANCKFAISTGTGWDEIPKLFRRPTMFLNIIPFAWREIFDKRLVLYPKMLVDEITNAELDLMTVILQDLHGAVTTSGYANSGVVIRDMNSDELVEAVTEMATRVEGTFVETPEQKHMQAKIKHILSTHPKLQPTPNYYPVRAEFASCFLSRYPNFLD